MAGLAAHELVDAAGVGEDDVVLVSGATGGVGLIATQLAGPVPTPPAQGRQPRLAGSST